ncbi:MAG: sigma-54 dependent transcriptional regulator [Rikenellaceae bacterium]
MQTEGYDSTCVINSIEGEYEATKAISENSPYDLLIINSKSKCSDGVLSKLNSIIISDTPTIDDVIDCFHSGAIDYIPRPYNMNKIINSIRQSLQRQSIDNEEHTPSKPSHRASKSTGYSQMVGNSPSITALRSMIDRVAPSEARVMILGENGTGKELVARSIHEKSCRYKAPFVEVNCAAIPSELIESELFGHEKGAFTSAIKQRKGKFEQANGGTIFLDEIGDMSLAAQAKMLRVLQERKICRVGSDKDIDIDVRIIAATNKDILTEVKNKTFREDLYHRIGVIIIHVDPLRDRIEDLPLLVRHFMESICHEYNIDCKEITEEALHKLSKLRWSGNIRELRNVIERLVIMVDKRIEAEHINTYCR